LDRFWIGFADDVVNRKEAIMLRRWSIGPVVIALVILMVMPAASAGKGGSDRPFKASFAGPVHWEWPGEFESECSEVTTVTHSFGNATHMGRTELMSSHCPDRDSSHERYDGRLTLIAANGDKLYGMYDYPAIDEGDPVMFIGGTGRFANATGEAVFVYDVVPVFTEGCQIDPEDPFPCMDFFVPWQWTSTLIGFISY
jgi:hypothetical protein